MLINFDITLYGELKSIFNIKHYECYFILQLFLQLISRDTEALVSSHVDWWFGIMFSHVILVDAQTGISNN